MATPIVHGNGFKDLTGQTFGLLTPVRFVGGRRWECTCACGRTVLVFVFNLRRGHTRSCGCLGKHGQHRSITYVSWESMIQRCCNPKATSFPLYGARGVTVCSRWRESFVAFHVDMGDRPSLTHSLDRIDNAGNYEPGNCRWATDQQQHRNRENNIMLTFRGQTRCAAEWAEILGMPRHLLYGRLRHGWAAERALTTPTGKYRMKEG